MTPLLLFQYKVSVTWLNLIPSIKRYVYPEVAWPLNFFLLKMVFNLFIVFYYLSTSLYFRTFYGFHVIYS